MSNMTQLEKVLAAELAKVAVIDVAAIIEAAQECCMGGCTPAITEVVVTPTPEVEKPKVTRKTPVKEVNPIAPNDQPQVEPKPASTPAPTPEPVAPVTPPTTPGIDLTGLFTGTGADKKVVKDVFLAAVEKAKSMAAINALNATADCGFAFGDFTDNEIEVARRKLKRWGAAQG